MASRHRVQCINKTNRTSAWDRIHSIGAPGWKLSLADAIAGIERGEWQFYVERPTGHVVEVVVATSAHGNKYLKTTADGEQPDNLLSLPECP